MEKKQVICSKCGSDNVVAKGTKGALGRSIRSAFLGPIISAWFAKSTHNDESSQNLQYKCSKCGNKFIPEEKPLESHEQVATTCKVIFHRDKNLVGAIVPQFVYLNGKKIGEVKNGKTIEFTTNVKSNTINVTDHLGMAFKNAYKFNAIESGIIEVHFNQKFK